MLKPGDQCRVRLKGQEEWVAAEVARHGDHGEHLAVYVDHVPEHDFSIVVHGDRNRVVLLLSFTEGVWRDTLSGADYEVLVNA